MTSKVPDNVIEGLQFEEDEDAVFLFGRDISKISCFKETFLTGIYSGIGGGILSFLATSRPYQSTHVAVGTFTVVSLGYWFVCRSRIAQLKFLARQADSTFPEEIDATIERKKRVQRLTLGQEPTP